MRWVLHLVIVTWVMVTIGCTTLNSSDNQSFSKNKGFESKYIDAVFKLQTYQNTYNSSFMSKISKKEIFKSRTDAQKKFLTCLSTESSKKKFQSYSKPFILKHFRSTSNAKLKKEMKVLQDSDFHKLTLYLSKSIIQGKGVELPNINPEKESWLQEVLESASYKDLRFLVGIDFENKEKLLTTFSNKVRTDCMKTSFR